MASPTKAALSWLKMIHDTNGTITSLIDKIPRALVPFPGGKRQAGLILGRNQTCARGSLLKDFLQALVAPGPVKIFRERGDTGLAGRVIFTGAKILDRRVLQEQ